MPAHATVVGVSVERQGRHRSLKVSTFHGRSSAVAGHTITLQIRIVVENATPHRARKRGDGPVRAKVSPTHPSDCVRGVLSARAPRRRALQKVPCGWLARRLDRAPPQGAQSRQPLDLALGPGVRGCGDYLPRLVFAADLQVGNRRARHDWNAAPPRPHPRNLTKPPVDAARARDRHHLPRALRRRPHAVPL